MLYFIHRNSFTDEYDLSREERGFEIRGMIRDYSSSFFSILFGSLANGINAVTVENNVFY